ncbi:MAG TPA: outer membrane beta-barrel protein [Candidatus Acidoferrales bacterium]|nr:outer membrane beta-barrel protein [Candidatus Acidoferrales bacterium]
MLGRKLIFVLLLIACSVSSAAAQSRYEIAPFFGAKYGGRILLNNPFADYDRIKSSEDFGVLFGYSLWDNFQTEFMWNRQPTTITQHNLSNNTFTTLGNTNMDMYHFGILYEFRSPEARIKPFFGAGLGWTHFGNGDSLIGFSNRYSYNLGGGMKYFPMRHFGFRLDIRYLATRTIPQQSVQNGFIITTSAHAKQGEANAGLVFRF